MTCNGSPLLEASDLSRRLPKARRDAGNGYAVRDVSLTLQAGDVLGLLGLNGAGKSTTLRMLAGCLVPHTGSVHIAGHSLDDEPMAARAELGYLADLPPLYDDMRVESYIQLCARLRGIPRQDVSRSVAGVIEECKLGEVARRRIGKLSKGFRQRVGIAQAIVHAPSVLLLDEPSNGLDPQQQEELRSLIKRQGEQRAVVFSTHLLGEVQACCTRVAIMHHGELMAEQTLADSNRENIAAVFAEVTSSAQQAA
jgi:ABC-2 type transport system ATP-binding protein